MPTIATVLDALRTVIDPDIGLDIVSLGLVERAEADAAGIRVGLIMTSPSCPQSSALKDEARALLLPLAEGGAVTIDILASPPWSPARLSPAARASLGWPEWR